MQNDQKGSGGETSKDTTEVIGVDKKEVLSIGELMKVLTEIEDPRAPGGNTRHLLVEILAIIFVAVLCNCDDTQQIEDYAKEKEQWLRTFLVLEKGVPSESTFRRTLDAIDPEELENAYRKWVYPYIGGCLGKQIAIDGKTLCGTSRCTTPVHMVSAWVREDGMTFGQIKTEEKSNEITAIPELLDRLDITGGIVTTDAMGCQKEIARKVVDQDANYVLAVKKNHPDLYECLEEYFNWAADDPVERKGLDVWEERDCSHGRVITRQVMVSDDIQWYDRKGEWAQLRSFIMVERIREKKDQTTKERAYYISSLERSAKKFGSLIRGHWSIENNLHWVLDVAFREDGSQVYRSNAAQNLSLVRKSVYLLLKNDPSSASIARKRKKAALNNSFAEAILRLLNPRE